MKVTVRQGRITVDVSNAGLLQAAFDTAAETWLELAAKSDSAPDMRKQMLKMAGEAKALCQLATWKQTRSGRKEPVFDRRPKAPRELRGEWLR